MEYAIRTLEIEIARLEYAHRIARTTPYPGNRPDIEEELARTGAELKKAVECLCVKQQEEEDRLHNNPQDGEDFHR